VWAIGEHGDASAAGALGELLATERTPEVRGTAAWVLGQLDLHSAPKGLIDAVGDADTDVRRRAAWALSEIGDGAAIPALRVALTRERDAEARKAEVRAPIHSGERTERLTELLESKDPEVRAAAIRGVAGREGVDPWPWPEPRPRPFP
jgi:HEAT repeat protein